MLTLAVAVRQLAQLALKKLLVEDLRDPNTAPGSLVAVRRAAIT